MRFGVFELASKRHSVKEVKEELVDTFVLRFRDGLGNVLEVAGTEDDFDTYEPGDILRWQMVFKQSTLDEER